MKSKLIITFIFLVLCNFITINFVKAESIYEKDYIINNAGIKINKNLYSNLLKIGLADQEVQLLTSEKLEHYISIIEDSNLDMIKTIEVYYENFYKEDNIIKKNIINKEEYEKKVKIKKQKYKEDKEQRIKNYLNIIDNNSTNMYSSIPTFESMSTDSSQCFEETSECSGSDSWYTDTSYSKHTTTVTLNRNGNTAFVKTLLVWSTVPKTRSWDAISIMHDAEASVIKDTYKGQQIVDWGYVTRWYYLKTWYGAYIPTSNWDMFQTTAYYIDYDTSTATKASYFYRNTYGVVLKQNLKNDYVSSYKKDSSSELYYKDTFNADMILNTLEATVRLNVYDRDWSYYNQFSFFGDYTHAKETLDLNPSVGGEISLKSKLAIYISPELETSYDHDRQTQVEFMFYPM